VDIEDESVKFVQGHIDAHYKELFSKYVIKEIYWVQLEVDPRPYATLIDSNIIALFPPWKLITPK
jgi:hypothetical protein